jgi:hypothetical protein
MYFFYSRTLIYFKENPPLNLNKNMPFNKKNPDLKIFGFNFSKFAKKRILRKILTNTSFGFICFVSIFGLIMITKSPTKTTDDTKTLSNILEKIPNKKILGASTENKDYLYGCTEKKPIIGWINYNGEKIITQNLPEGETASGCFESQREAQNAGFVIK